MEVPEAEKPHEQGISPSQVEKASAVTPGHLLGAILALFFTVRFMLPFLSLALIFALLLTGLLITGIVVIRLSKHDDEQLRSRFPRLRFTRTEEWRSEIARMASDDQLGPSQDATQFIRASETLIQLVARDFINGWFLKVSSSKAFPAEVMHQMRLALSELERRAVQIDISSLLVLEIIPVLNRHFVSFCSAEDTVLSENGHLGPAELDLMVARESDNISKLNPFVPLNTDDNEREKKMYSRDRVSKILDFLISTEELGSGPVFVLIREILTNTVFFPVLRLLSDSDFWNQMTVKLVTATLKDRTQVRELRDALDKQYKNPHKKQQFKGVLFEEKITPQMRQHEFLRYMKNIGKSTSINSLKQLKYYIAVQISRTHRIQSTSDKFVKYTRRLNLARESVDKQIAELSEEQPSSDVRRRSILQHPNLDRFISKLTLDQLLSNPSSLSFFMEFMEQRSRTVLLQYWITVNGIRDPLEDPQSPDYEEELASSGHLHGVEDIKLIFDQFFSQKLLRVSRDVYEEVASFANGHDRSLEKYINVRKMILMLQLNVFQRMEQRDLPDFKGSDLFLKLLASETFEQSLVNEVDTAHDDGGELADTHSNDDEGSLLELENALSNILSDNLKRPPLTVTSSTTDILASKTDTLKSDLFGSEEKGFMNEKPLFDDSEEDVDPTEHENQKLETDPEFPQFPQDALNLKEEIVKLEQNIAKLTQQSEMLDPLILKAELTNNINELRLLKKSQSSFTREIESKELMKQQLIVYENENSLFGKTKVNITSWVKARANGSDYIVYVMEIVRTASTEGKPPTSWIIGRRFSQFYAMNEILKREFPVVENIPFPKKKIVLKFQQKSLIDERRSQLEQYIRSLLEIQKVCQNIEFRKFLTTDDYRTEEPSREAMDTASKLYSGMSSESRSQSSDNLIEEPQSEQAEDMRRELENYESERNRGQSFVKPITEIFIALFPLNNTNSWLRGRAIIVILQKVLGNTIERYIKDHVSQLTTEGRVVDLLGILTGIIWPEGRFMQSGTPRTTMEKLQSKREAKVLLEKLMVDSLSKIVGVRGSKHAAVRVHAMLQNDILNLALTFDILDAVLRAMFPEMTP